MEVHCSYFGGTSTALDLSLGFTIPEEEECTIHTLKVNNDQWLKAQQFLQFLLSLHYTEELRKFDSCSNMLWTNELALAFLKSQIRVSRTCYNGGMRERFNASRRPIGQLVNSQDTAVELALGPQSKYILDINYIITASNTGAEALTASNDACINVTDSIAKSVCRMTPLSHIIIGTDERTNVTTVAISSSKSSRVVARKDKSALFLQFREGDRAQFLAQLYNRMQVERILAICRKCLVLLVHKPCYELVASIVEVTAHRDMTVFFTACLSIPQQDKA